jgi:thiamine biosynthesis lipoprotein
MRLVSFFIFNLFQFVLILPVSAQVKKYHFSSSKMGSPLNLVFVDTDSTHASQIAKTAFELVDSLVHIYSDYDSSSELSRLSAQAGKGAVPVSKGLLEILLKSKEAYKQSQHSFDITMGPLSMLWRNARKTKRFPDSALVAATKILVGFDKLVIDQKNQTVSLAKEGMRLDLGGIAKGFVAEKIVKRLKTMGIVSSLVDAGGDIAMGEAPLQAKGWVVGVNVPEETDELLDKKLLLKNMSVATSGDVYQYFLHQGKKYAHITNPKTGYGVTFQRNVTVIATDGATADWLATACSILPIKTALETAAGQKAFVLITTVENNQIKAYKSKGFDRFWKKD